MNDKRVVFLVGAVIGMLGLSMIPTFNNTGVSSISQERNADTARYGNRDVVGGWSVEVVDNGPKVGYDDISMVMEPNGNIHISYHDDHNNRLKYAKWDGTSWSISSLADMGIKNYGTSLALDPYGNPHISFSQSGKLKLFSHIGGTWTNETVEGGEGGAFSGCYSSLAIDSKNHMHLSYQNATAGVFDLLYAKKAITHWTYETLDSDGTTGKFVSMALDSSEHPHISYQTVDDGNTMRYIKWTGTGWDNETVDAQTSTGYHSSIALDSSDNPHIAYFSARGGFDKYLTYARWSGSGWEIENADPVRKNGRYPSIAIDDNDRPHISYYGDFDNSHNGGNLKYAHYDGVSWDIVTLDSSGETGEYSSIALDGNGRPTIAYFDETLEILKIIRWDAVAPVANAGADIVIDQHERAHFNGTASTDNFMVANYEWTIRENDVNVTLNGPEPYHKFNHAGTYEVSVNVTDLAGNWALDGANITVRDVDKPAAAAGSGYFASQHDTVTFNGTGSTDNVGVDGYAWTFVYDGEPRELSGEFADFVFNTAGNYNVTLNVTDTSGNWGVDTTFVVVYDITMPVAEAGGDVTVKQLDTVTFNGSGSTDNVGVDVYEWSFEYNRINETLDGLEASFTFYLAGTYTVTLKVSDERGNWDVDTMTVTVLDMTPPVANAGEENILARQGVPVLFNGSASSDNVGIDEYEWIFIDDNQSRSLSGERVNYTFDIIGLYNVTLRVIDVRGNKGESVFTVNVTDGIPPIAVAKAPLTAYLGTTVLFNGSESSDNVEIVKYVWSFHYKYTDDMVLKGETVTFPFDKPGNYTITLTVTDGQGNFNTTNITLDILKKDTDSDNDGMHDGWEQENGMDPTDPSDAGEDPDGDGMTNQEEFEAGTDPNNADTGGGVDGKKGGSSNWTWLIIALTIVFLLCGGGIIAIVVAKKKQKEREKEEEKKGSEEEKEESPEDYYARLYGTVPGATSSSAQTLPQTGPPTPGGPPSSVSGIPPRVPGQQTQATGPQTAAPTQQSPASIQQSQRHSQQQTPAQQSATPAQQQAPAQRTPTQDKAPQPTSPAQPSSNPVKTPSSATPVSPSGGPAEQNSPGTQDARSATPEKSKKPA